MGRLTELDETLAGLAAALTASNAEEDFCLACHRMGKLREWPLGRRPGLVCRRCWLDRVRGDVTEAWSRQGCRVSTVHPQHGELLRGTIRAVGVEPRELQPVTVWLVQDQDAVVVDDRFVGDFVDVRARLLNATGWADQLDRTTGDSPDRV